MAEETGTSDAGLEREEARLARAAAAGDGAAFATLYERYARRAYNLALRLSGSDDDAADAVQEAFLKVMRRLPEMEGERELSFGSYLFTATRNATYDLLRRQQRTGASDSIPESAVPLGAGAGGLGLDPGDPGEDPDRRVLLGAQQEEVRAANARLPERQREALALRELEEMSYDEIAAVMGMNRNSVAQLISRARINLRDELRGTALASVATSSPECERALPLIASRDDGQLDEASADAAWLVSHLSTCDTCAVAREAMQEAGVSYRAWIPVAIAPWLFKATMAKAAELTGGDWSAVAEERLESPAEPGSIPGLPTAYREAADAKNGRRRLAGVLAGLAALLLLGGGAVALSAGGGGEPPPPGTQEEVADEFEKGVEAPAPKAVEKSRSQPESKPERTAEPELEVAESPVPEPTRGTESPTPGTTTTKDTQTREPKAEPAPQTRGGSLDGPKAVTEPVPEPEPEFQPPAATPPVEEPTEPVPPRDPPNEPPPTVTPGGPNPRTR
jgi:RNA polymerase sigma-70 factor (ECF subfamily)